MNVGQFVGVSPLGLAILAVPIERNGAVGTDVALGFNLGRVAVRAFVAVPLDVVDLLFSGEWSHNSSFASM